MADEESNGDFKKNGSNGFLLFLFGTLLIFFMVQNLTGSKLAKVSFSGQVEHLVNLDLIQKEESKKIALNDNLVTFSGKFREKLTDEGKRRYKYLELLHESNQLKNGKVENLNQLAELQQSTVNAADWFLHLRGEPLPQEGYRVVDPFYDTFDRKSNVIIRRLSDKDLISIAHMQNQLAEVKRTSNQQQIDRVGESLSTLVKSFQSPILGIGNEPLKDEVRKIFREVEYVRNGSKTARQQLVAYEKALRDLHKVVATLDRMTDHVRLNKLRSVRKYRSKLVLHRELLEELEENSAKLEKARGSVEALIWFFNDQELSTRTLEKQDPELLNHWFLASKQEWEAFEANKGGYFKAPDQKRNLVLEKTFKSEEPGPNYLNYLFTFLPVILIILVLYFVFSRQMKGMGGGGAMNFGKSPAKLMQKSDNKVTFKDVAGVDEASEELEEISEFLKNPEKFTRLGGRIPKGVLCVGPPGTGKTLIARAVAGEADRPFFSISGSDFVEMFVGVGASRIRDMFEQAKKNAPCIIFIDEIDAVGRHRGAGVGGGHDEREQTLNQLLVEMDGFDTKEGVILMAATNRPDVLDKALLRPGRFDRRIVLELPDIKGRYEILKLHAKKIKMDDSVDLMMVAKSTPGASGADLENLLNEAALLAARKNRNAVTAAEAMEARDKVRYGKERRSLEFDEQEKETTAYHESGHAVVGMVVEHGEPIEKVTIIPRGMALGGTHFLPKKNRLSYWKNEIIDQLAVLMGGRAAEEIFVGDVSSGAQNDIERATGLARCMVCEWGMSDILGTVTYDKREDGGQYLGLTVHQTKNYSEATAKVIDQEVRNIIDAAYERSLEIIKEHKDKVVLMTEMLMEYETLDDKDVALIMEGKWDAKEKDKRVKEAEELHKRPEGEEEEAKKPPPPPPFPDLEKEALQPS